MTPVEVTAGLLHHLVAGSHAEGTTCLAVAAVIDHDDRVLLIAQPGDDFDRTFELPADLVLPGETLLDALHRIVATTTGLDLHQVTGYLGHHDDPSAETTRTFRFAVTVTDPDAICRSGRLGHRWACHDDLTGPAAFTEPAASTPAAQEPPLSEPLRAGARGIYPDEAAIELLIGHATFLHRSDFTDRFVQPGHNPDGHQTIASLDWTAAISALDAGDLPCSSSEARILRLAASLARGLPVNLRDTTTGIDARSAELLSRSVLHAAGHSTAPLPP